MNRYPRSPVTVAAVLTAGRSALLALPRPLLLSAAGMATFALLTALGAHLRLPLPFTPVPVTLQTAVVLLAGATLGPAAGAGSQALYLVLGAAGLPMFTTGALWGPTLGYLVAFLPAAAMVGFARRRWGWAGMIAGMAAASALILLLGAAGLMLTTGLSARAALAAGAVPFVPGDLLKLIAAAGAARLTIPAWRRLRG